MGDPFPVLVRLGRKAQHKVQLDLVPASAKGHGGSDHDVILRDAFVDDIPKPLGPGFRCKGQRTLPDILHFLHDVQGEIVDSQGRKGDINGLSLKVADQILQKFRKSRIIA